MTDFEPEDAPIPALSKLKALTAERTTARGLDLRGFLIDPNLIPAGPHHVQVIVSLNDEWDANATAQEADPEFDRVIREAEQAEMAEKAAEARSNLEALRDTLSDRSKGIGLDD